MLYNKQPATTNTKKTMAEKRDTTLGIGDMLGKGAESRCYEHELDPDTEKIITAIKAPRKSSYFWQTVTKKHLQKCIDTAKKYGIKILPTEIIEEVILFPTKGRPFKAKLAIIVKYVENIDQCVLTFKELTDPEKGPSLLRQLMEIAEKMYYIRKDEDLGLDPVGAKMISEGVKAIIKAVILQATHQTPELVRKVISQMFATYKGEVNNVIVDEHGELVLMDTGMHDFSPEGKLQMVTNLANRYQHTTLIEIIYQANKMLPKDKQIPEEEISAIPCIGNVFDQILTQILITQAVVTIKSTLEKESKVSPK